MTFRRKFGFYICRFAGNGRPGTIIHNYGHGGSGVTTAWGCATDVLNLVQERLNGDSNVKSKL